MMVVVRKAISTMKKPENFIYAKENKKRTPLVGQHVQRGCLIVSQAPYPVFPAHFDVAFSSPFFYQRISDNKESCNTQHV